MAKQAVGASAGYTLSELLVVIGVIMILLSLLMPLIGKIRQQAQVSQCASNMRQIYQATSMFCNDNNDRFFIAPEIGSTAMTRPFPFCIQSLGIVDYSQGLLWNYIPGDDSAHMAIMKCPADIEECPNNHPGIQRNFSYSFNAGLNWANGGYVISGTPNCVQFKMSQIVASSHKILIWEEVGPNDGLCCCLGGDRDDYPTQRHMIHGKRVSDNGSNPNINGGGYGNQCFADGHVELLEPQAIWSNPYYCNLRMDQ